MTADRIAAERTIRQRLAAPGSADAAETVAWFGAVQSQDVAAARWAVALRMRGAAVAADIDRELAAGRILRTHVMRPTWHFVAAADVRWLIELTAPRVHQALAFGRRHYGLSDALHRRANRIIERALDKEETLTRVELGQRLARNGIPAKGVPLALIVIHAELEAIVCSGPLRGRHSTYMLFDRRAPRAARMPRDQALAELTTRYFRSHGPATARDFAWWSGLTAADVKRGLDMVGARNRVVDGLTYWTVGAAAEPVRRGGVVHLLPMYDEYLVAYRDHAAVPRDKAFWGLIPQAVVCGGQVAGAWKLIGGASGSRLAVDLVRKLTAREQLQLDRAFERYSRFVGVGS